MELPPWTRLFLVNKLCPVLFVRSNSPSNFREISWGNETEIHISNHHSKQHNAIIVALYTRNIVASSNARPLLPERLLSLDWRNGKFTYQPVHKKAIENTENVREKHDLYKLLDALKKNARSRSKTETYFKLGSSISSFSFSIARLSASQWLKISISQCPEIYNKSDTIETSSAHPVSPRLVLKRNLLKNMKIMNVGALASVQNLMQKGSSGLLTETDFESFH